VLTLYAYRSESYLTNALKFLKYSFRPHIALANKDPRNAEITFIDNFLAVENSLAVYYESGYLCYEDT
jgi:hypothetical protein